MAENLKYKVSRGCWAYDSNERNVNLLGYLYDWETAKKACPVGWHLPSVAEWNILINYLGGEDIAGGMLKSTSNWTRNIEATNSSGFSAIPGGCYFNSGKIFNWAGVCGYWWTSTQKENDSGDAWFMNIYSSSAKIEKNFDFKLRGFSVRCIRN